MSSVKRLPRLPFGKFCPGRRAPTDPRAGVPDRDVPSGGLFKPGVPTKLVFVVSGPTEGTNGERARGVRLEVPGKKSGGGDMSADSGRLGAFDDGRDTTGSLAGLGMSISAEPSCSGWGLKNVYGRAPPVPAATTPTPTPRMSCDVIREDGIECVGSDVDMPMRVVDGLYSLVGDSSVEARMPRDFVSSWSYSESTNRLGNLCPLTLWKLDWVATVFSGSDLEWPRFDRARGMELAKAMALALIDRVWAWPIGGTPPESTSSGR